MRDKNRIFPLTNTIAALWYAKYPDWRFGQLIENFRKWHEINYKTADIFYLEDELFEERFIKYMGI